MKKKWLCLFTALAVIVGVCAAAPMSGEAVSLELDKTDCSMKIFPENPEKPEGAVSFGDDLNQANVLVDIYKVADAEKISGYDSYTYVFQSPYRNLEEAKSLLTKLEQSRNSSPKKSDTDRTDGELKASDWQALAQAVAKEILGDGKDKQPAENIQAYINSVAITDELKNKVSMLDTGLYLIIAKGSGMDGPEDYRVRMQGKSHTSEMDGDIATIANSDNYTYIFAPQLISLPMRDGDVRGDNPESENGPLPDLNDDYMTSDLGSWVYDLNVYLKPVRVMRYGSLEISKKLQVYESEEDVLLPEEGGSEPVDGSIGQDEKTTFVFKATWNDPNDGGKQKSRVDSLTFPIIKDGKKIYDWQLYMDGIPVGTEVTVEEIYSGASYEIVGSKTQKVTIGRGTENIQNGIAILDEKDAVVKIVSQGADDSEGKRTEVGASVAFTNTYNRNQRKGYGINNEFVYDDTGTPGWKWIVDGEIQKNGNGEDYKIPVDTTTAGTGNPDNPGGTDNTGNSGSTGGNENTDNTDNTGNNENTGGTTNSDTTSSTDNNNDTSDTNVNGETP